MSENNNIEISPRDNRLVNFYESKLEKDPDKAIEKTMRHFHLGETQVRSIIKEYSKYPTPSAYIKSVKDNEAIGNLVGDEFSEKYEEFFSGDLILIIKSFEKKGINIKEMFIEFIQALEHDGITELTGDNLTSLKKKIPFRKSLEQQAKDMKYKAQIKGDEKKIVEAETRMGDSRFSRHIAEVAEQKIKGDEQSDYRDFNDGEIENIVYNKEYEEQYNELTELILEASIPHNKPMLELKKKLYQMKWGFRIPQAEERRQLTVKRKREIAESEVIQKVEKLDAFLDGLSREELIGLEKEVDGVI